MKKALMTLAVLALLLTASLSVSAAGGTATVTSAAGVAPGETITFTVTISGADPVRAVMIAPTYDTAAFELVEGRFLRSGMMTDFGDKDGVIMWSTPTDVNGGLMTFTLKAKETATMGASYTVGCEYTLQNADDQRQVGTVSACTVKILGEHTTTTEDHVYDNPCDKTCNVCGESRTTAHVYGDGWVADDTAHWQTCIHCHVTSNKATHAPDGNQPQHCTVCGQALPDGQDHIHSYTTDWTHDETAHWHACSCGSVTELSVHSWGEQTVIKAATTEEEGVLRTACTVCSAYREEFTAKLTATPTTTQNEGQSPSTPKKPVETWVLVLASLLAVSLVVKLVLSLRKKKK